MHWSITTVQSHLVQSLKLVLYLPCFFKNNQVLKTDNVFHFEKHQKIWKEKKHGSWFFHSFIICESLKGIYIPLGSSDSKITWVIQWEENFVRRQKKCKNEFRIVKIYFHWLVVCIFMHILSKFSKYSQL